MKIDLPITIIFDNNNDRQSIPAGTQVFTLRYELDGDGTDALLIPGFPPSEPVDEKYSESGQSILAHISKATDDKIKVRARRSPYDYMVGTEQERAVAQEEVDEAEAQGAQFGAGA
ncbi:hypothetical protein [uncultured Devosia sp.]|uniref:hypothetical protein n=1 Tax=uncultured Devosia sp. TaxID=211434 RepID=UPI00261AADA8|nr:hypothetical protein [uncultured Devosia sp.]